MQESSIISEEDAESSLSTMRDVITHIMNEARLQDSDDSIDYIDKVDEENCDENNNEMKNGNEKKIDSCQTTPQTNKIDSLMAEISQESPFSNNNDTHNQSSIVDEIKHVIGTPKVDVKSPHSISQLAASTPIAIEIAKLDLSKIRSPITNVDSKLGRIKLNIQYEEQRSMLSIKVLEAK